MAEKDKEKELAERFYPLGFAPDGTCLIVAPGDPRPDTEPVIYPDKDSEEENESDEADISDLDDYDEFTDGE